MRAPQIIQSSSMTIFVLKPMVTTGPEFWGGAPQWCERWFINTIKRIWLVVLTILKNMSSSVGMIIPYIMEKYKMFQTTNQIFFHKA